MIFLGCCLIFAISISVFAFIFVVAQGSSAFRRERRGAPRINNPGWVCRARPSSCVTRLIMFGLLVQLVWRRALIRALALVWEQVQAVAVQARWRGSKHKTSSLEVSLVPVDVSCGIFPRVPGTRMLQLHLPAPFSEIEGWAAPAGEREDSARAV